MSAIVAAVSAFALVCCSFAAVAFGLWLLVDIRARRGQAENRQLRAMLAGRYDGGGQ